MSHGEAEVYLHSDLLEHMPRQALERARIMSFIQSSEPS